MAVRNQHTLAFDRPVAKQPRLIWRKGDSRTGRGNCRGPLACFGVRQVTKDQKSTVALKKKYRPAAS